MSDEGRRAGGPLQDITDVVIRARADAIDAGNGDVADDWFVFLNFDFHLKKKNEMLTSRMLQSQDLCIYANACIYVEYCKAHCLINKIIVIFKKNKKIFIYILA